MNGCIVVFGMIVTAQSAGVEPAHAANSLYSTLRKEGWDAGTTRVAFPAPSLSDDATADQERTALREIAGSDHAAAELTRDSVTAPFILKTHDLESPEGLIRQADLWFVVRADLDAIDPDKLGAGGTKAETVEAGNMRFTGRKLDGPELERRGFKGPKDPANVRDAYAHLTARLLDRIHVEATDHIIASKGQRSWVIASMTDHRFDSDRDFPNRWWPITRNGVKEEAERSEAYSGGSCYIKIIRLVTVPGGLLLETHFAFHEPRAWFDGAPILRSKIGVVAQDRIRGLRRELAKSRKGAAGRIPSSSRGG